MTKLDDAIEGLKKVWNAFNGMEHELYADYVFDALELLKGQEPVYPTWRQGKSYCGACGKRIPQKIDARFCHKCGVPINWH